MKQNQFTRAQERVKVVQRPGLTRTTLSYNNDLMICHFHEEKDTKIELHTHLAVQNGYVLKGKIRFFLEDGVEFIALPGSAYVFDSMEPHSSIALEETELIESFTPMRPEYL